MTDGQEPDGVRSNGGAPVSPCLDAGVTAVNQCPQCRKEFRKNWRATFCSPSCAMDYRYPSRTAPRLLCKGCGAELKKTSKAYCSQKCRSAVAALGRKCAQCGKPNVAQNRLYCSDVCLNESRINRLGDLPRCLCGKAIPRTHKFCSVSCANSIRKTQRPPCLMCGNIVAEPRNRYCSTKCASAVRRSILTPERESLIKTLYESGVQRAEIAAKFNNLPGPKAKADYINGVARRLGLKRPDGYRILPAAVQARPVKPPTTAMAMPLSPPKKRTPIGIPEWKMRALATSHGTKRTLEALNKLIRSEDPTHPGYRLITTY